MCMVLFEICMVIFEKCQLLVAELRDTSLSWLKIIFLYGMSGQKFRTIETLFPLKRKVRKLKQDVITINSTTND